MKWTKKHSSFETSVVTKDQVFPLGFPIALLDIKDMYKKRWISCFALYDLCNVLSWTLYNGTILPWNFESEKVLSYLNKLEMETTKHYFINWGYLFYFIFCLFSSLITLAKNVRNKKSIVGSPWLNFFTTILQNAK